MALQSAGGTPVSYTHLQSPSLPEIQKYCLAQVDTLWDEMKRFEFPHRYYVDLSQNLWQAKRDLLDSIR